MSAKSLRNISDGHRKLIIVNARRDMAVGMAVVNGCGGDYAQHEPVVDLQRGRVSPDVPGSGLRLERVPDSAFEGIWMDDFQVTLTFTISWFFLGCAAVLGGCGCIEPAARGGDNGGFSVGLRRVSGELLGAQAVVAVSHVWVLGGIGLGMGYIVRSPVLVNMVSGSPGVDHGMPSRDSARIAHFCAGCPPSDERVGC